MIQDICTQGTDSIHDMRVVNTGTAFYQSKTPEKFLETNKRLKKRKYINSYLNKRRHFTPFVALVYGLLGVEMEVTLKRISSRFVQNWKEPYSCTCGYMKSVVAITLVRATHRCIQGARFPVSWISVTLSH